MRFSWALEVGRADGTVAVRTPLLPDWGAASGWVRFQGIRRGLLPPVLTGEQGEVAPVWDAERGAPYVAAARIAFRAAGGGEPVSEQVPVACLAGQIADLLRVLLRAGRLTEGEIVYPKVCAHQLDDERAVADAGTTAGAGGGIGIEEIPVPLDLRETPIGELLRVAQPRDVAAEDDDVPVFLPASVFAGAEALARASADLETGGFLLGHLHRDPARPECFVEVTAQIPARHTVAERTRLTFTPDTWAAMEGEVRARGRDEEVVGFWHLHPFFCRACPPERRRDCTLDSKFFSAEDVRLFGLGFGQAYKTALLLSEREGGVIERSLFGWRRGVVAARGYHEIADADAPGARCALEEVTR